MHISENWTSLCEAAHSIGLDIDPDGLKRTFLLVQLGQGLETYCRPFLIFEMLKFIEMSLFMECVHLLFKLCFLFVFHRYCCIACLKQTR